MEKNGKNIDHLFKEELGSYTETPPPAAWDALEKRMAARPAAKPSFGFRKVGYLALLVAVVSFTAVTIARKNADNAIAQNDIAANENISTIAPDAARANNAVSQTEANNKTKTENTPVEKEQVSADAPKAAGNATIAKNEVKQNANTPADKTSPATPAINKPELTNQTSQKTLAEQSKHIVPQATATTTHNSPVAAQHVAANTTAKNEHTTTHHTVVMPRAATVNATANTAPVTRPSYIAANKTTTHLRTENVTATAEKGSDNTVAHQSKIIPQAHKKNTSHALALNTTIPASVTPAPIAYQQAGPRDLSKPADIDNNAEESTETPVTGKTIVPQAHKTTTNTPALAKKSNPTKNGEEEVVSLTTGMKQIGINNSLGAMTQKSVPGITLPVYNNSINPEPEMRWNSGSKPQADAPVKTTVATSIPQAVVKTTPKAKEEFDRFEAGIKAGYETGFSYDAATKFVASPYIQYNLSPKFALMLQPAIKTAKVNTRPIGDAKSYYKVNGDGATKFADSTPLYVLGTAETLWVKNYTYSQTHDSVVKTNTYGGTYIEVEMPLLLKYYIAPKFAVYAGANVAYSKLSGVKEHTYTSAPITQTGTASSLSTQPAPALNTVITYTGTPYSGYTGPEYTGTNGSSPRLGYMAGFSYQLTDKWMIDGLMQQGMAKQDVKAGYNINSAISAAYFRFTIGYKLTK